MMMNRHSLAALLCVGALSACDFEKTAVQSIAGPTAGNANIKFFNYGPNAPQVNFYADNTKLSAISSATGAEATTGVAYGSQASGGFYTSMKPGQYTFTGKIAAATDKDLSISPVQFTIADGKNYSYFLSGIYNTTAKTADAFIVEDPIPAAFDFTQAFVRFVNASSNAPSAALFVKSTTNTALAEVAIGAATAYKGATAFVAVPDGTYDLNARLSGSSTNAVTTTGQSFAAGRYYTVVLRGDWTQSPTGTNANRPILTASLNR